MFEYHSVLHIAVLCNIPLLWQLINDAEPIDRFEHVIKKYSSADELPEECDVIFIDKNSPSITELRKKYSAPTRIILCADSAYAESLSEEELYAADRIWDTPLTERLTKRRFHRMCEEIRVDKDCRLYQNCLDAAIDTLPDMLWFKSVDGIHTKVNRAFCNIVGKTREDVTGKDHCYIWDVSREEFDNGANACQESEEQVMKEKRTLQFMETVQSKQGMRQFKTYKSPIFDEDGSILGTVGIGHDVTDLKNLDTELDIVLRSMPYGILMTDENGIIIDINSKVEEYFGVDRKDILGKPYDEWFEKAFEADSIIDKEDNSEGRVSNSDRLLAIYDAPICDIFQKVVGGLNVFRDITRLRALEEQIVRSSNTDFLTGLDNRRSFYQYIKNKRKGRPITLLCIDLDHFKKLNDTFGHQVGDEALVRVSNLFKSHFEDDFITRFGGDEFVIAIMGECSEKEALERAEKLQKAAAEEFSGTDMSLLTLSVGISHSDEADIDIDYLIKQGDNALYKAKQNGRGCCVVYSE